MFLKTFLLFIISINLTLPLNDKLDIIILALTILMIILTKSIVPMKEIYKKRYSVLGDFVYLDMTSPSLRTFFLFFIITSVSEPSKKPGII